MPHEAKPSGAGLNDEKSGQESRDLWRRCRQGGFRNNALQYFHCWYLYLGINTGRVSGLTVLSSLACAKAIASAWNHADDSFGNTGP